MAVACAGWLVGVFVCGRHGEGVARGPGRVGINGGGVWRDQREETCGGIPPDYLIVRRTVVRAQRLDRSAAITWRRDCAAGGDERRERRELPPMRPRIEVTVGSEARRAARARLIIGGP
jgi:hypothetical protein